MLNAWNKERILKAVRGKGQVTYKGRPIRITREFPTATVKEILDRCHTDLKKTQKPGKILNQYRWTRTKPNLTNIWLLNQLYREFYRENSNTRRVPTPKKRQDINHLTTKPKGENHTQRMSHTTTKIAITNNHQLISFNINRFNSPIKRHKLDTQT